MINDANALSVLRRAVEKVEILAGERGDGLRSAVRRDEIASTLDQAVTAALKDAGILFGTGTPEGNVAAKVGAIYRNTSGATGTTIYVKETGGAGPTGWAAK